MEEELRLSLLLLGGLFILGVLAHGLWNIRKNSQAKKPQTRIEPQGWQENDGDDEAAFQRNQEEFDEYGIGEVRVVQPSAEQEEDAEPFNASLDSESAMADSDEAENGAAVTDTAKPNDDDTNLSEESLASQQEQLYASVVTNPKPQYQNDNVVELPSSVPAPPSFLLKGEAKAEPETNARDNKDNFSLHAQPAPKEQKASVTENKTAVETEAAPTTGKKRGRSATRRRQEPRIGDKDQMQIDFDDSVKSHSGKNATTDASAKIEPEVLILNVRAPEDAPISGAALLPMLLTLGFKFGDQDIFHRHVNSNGKGPVLFSLANMFKPGNFDIDHLETFTTRGVSLFMLLPIEGDPHQVFNMMHNAARKIAEEFNAQVLDGRRSVLSKQGLQQYVEKIRDFERKRMIAR